jgi:hypothetical protein
MGDRERKDASPERGQEVTCTLCHRDIGRCAFCDEERCPGPVCYRCVVVPLRRSLSAMHSHGG